MTIHWPQIVYLALWAINLGIHAAKDGQPTNNKYSLGKMLLMMPFSIALMYYGGFFSGVQP